MTFTRDTSHLAELMARRGRNRARLAAAVAESNAQAVEYWTAIVEQNTREIASEDRILGNPVETLDDDGMTIDEILKELEL